MKKATIKKVGVLITVVIVFRFLVVLSLNYINEKNTTYLQMKDNNISAEEIVRGPAKALYLEENTSEKNSFVFYIEASDKEELTIMYDRSYGAYSIYVNDVRKVQNYNKSSANYTERLAYYILDIKESDYQPVEGSNLVKIELERYRDTVEIPMFYLGDKNDIRQFMDIRIAYNTVMLMGFFMILIVSLLFYFRDQANYMLITLIISIVSTYKCVVSGQLYEFSHLFNINGQNYYFYDYITSIVNLFLYFTLIYILFEYKMKKNHIYIFMSLYLTISAIFLFSENLKFLVIILILGDIAIVLLEGIGYLNSKRYSIILLVAYNIFSGFVIYAITIYLNYVKKGIFSSVVFGPQIGSFIFIFVFLIAVIRTYFNRMKEYERQQSEYKRVTLLRGISHDLKMPLAVIQLNNQMLERYNMTTTEGRDYINSSIEATQELQNMTNNINFYLNMDGPIKGENRTSIKACFIKLKNHYRSRKKNHEILQVYIDENDYILEIEPLQFERMLYNLIDNAFKYNKNNNEVKISYSISENVIIVIEDGGVGMEDEAIEKIFEPFFKSDTSRSSEGFGLGLSVVKGIVNKLSGEILVESQLGIGTKITIEIPL